jgi:dTMP kinase
MITRYQAEQMLGKLIVFEGGEGCGKTTQLARAHQWLSQRLNQQLTLKCSLAATREPGGTALGSQIRQLLLTDTGEPMDSRTELLLYAADRAQHVETFLRPHLAQGALILCDRYTDSTVAYQGYGRQLDLDLIHQLNQVATHGLQSDLTLWLDLDVEIGLQRAQQRGKRDRIEQADLAFHQRVRDGFRALAGEWPDRIVRIDASAGEVAVAEQIQTVLRHWLDGQSAGSAC